MEVARPRWKAARESEAMNKGPVSDTVLPEFPADHYNTVVEKDVSLSPFSSRFEVMIGRPDN